MDKKKILFVCVENSCRSQIAEGFANHLGKDKLVAYSAGSKPAYTIEPKAVTVMRELGIDISQQNSKGFNDLTVKNFDYAITLGCKDICPFVPAEKHIHWDIEDPKGKSIEFFRKVRDELKQKIEDLIKNLA
ncbi:MAG: arsenate reductase ArsC [Candidatus Omnitrophica bacterium]|nr:arsenate reductase ArsC [Candidatus Omnitrophota bacterium]